MAEPTIQQLSAVICETMTNGCIPNPIKKRTDYIALQGRTCAVTWKYTQAWLGY